MSELLDMLLGAGSDIVDPPRGEYELTRLSDALGQPFIVKAHALSMKEFDSLPRGDDWKVHVLLTAVDDPDLRSARLGERYKPDGRNAPLTPVEVVYKLLLPGEITNLCNEIMALSGFDDHAVDKITKK